MIGKSKRLRDPVHNLIEFGTTPDREQRQLEQELWRIIRTPAFQCAGSRDAAANTDSKALARLPPP